MTSDWSRGGRDAGAELLPLAEAKLAPPRSRPGLVERPRILTSLSAAHHSTLTLVAAPAGYGKTTAVEAWCAMQPLPVAWVTLDPGDNDAVRLWMYVAKGLDRVRPGLGQPTLRRLRVAGADVWPALDELLNRVALSGVRLVMVLEDLHLVKNQEALASLDHALEHLPANVRLVVLTRADPPLRVPEMRARRSLTEMRAADLAFTTHEALEFLIGLEHLELDEVEVARLCERTEGWPAALSLAALWLRGVEDPHAAVREFGGDHRFVAEYLTDAVIRNLDADERRFVLQASVLGRFTPEVCDAVLGRSDSAKVLDQLERTNLFIARLGNGEWFRVHSLFAEFATSRLASLEPGVGAAIHSKAARWLRDRRLVGEAAPHAAAAGDHEFLADMLGEGAPDLVRRGGSRTIIHWARTLPESSLVQSPIAALGAAHALAVLGHGTLELRRFLRLADSGAGAGTLKPDGGDLPAIVSAARCSALEDDVRGQLEEAIRGLDFAEQGTGEYVVPALGQLGRTQYLAGDTDAAWRTSLRAVENPEAERRPMGHAAGRSTMAIIAAERGRLSTARLHAERAQLIVAGIGNSRTWIGAATGSLAIGVVLAAEGNLAEAERNLALADGLLEDEVATAHHVWALLLLTRTRCRRGRLVEAETSLRSARAELHELADGGRLPSLLAEVEHELAVARRRVAGGDMLEPPSDAELAVLRLLASDLSARQIGAQLFVSLNTVRSHTRALYRKLGVNSRAEAIGRAAELDLLTDVGSPV